MSGEIEINPSSAMETPMVQVGNQFVPDTRQGGTALENFHEDFEGLGSSPYPELVTIDGESFQYKRSDRRESKLELQLLGGRAVWQYYDEDAKTFIKSYDNVTTTEGEPVSLYAGKLRHCMEIDWAEAGEEGQVEKKQLILSPTSRYMFEEFAAQLKKRCNKRIREVTAIVTIMRDQNKEGKKFSKAAFTCAELTAAGWEPPKPKR